MSSRSKTLLLLCAFALISFTCSEAQSNDTLVEFHIRAVRAHCSFSGVRKKGIQKIDTALQDISNKLSSLPYKKFLLIATESVTVPLLRRRAIQLADGHVLSLRPYPSDDGQLSVALRWTDKSGMKILDTRMRIPEGESVIAGTERTDDSGVVLIIDAKTVERPPT